jgi:8-oxo-dGTP pyrophosphatase MutT (NUDIX family)
MEAIAGALVRTERPIPVDPRFTPQVAGDDRPRYDRATFPPARPAATLLAVYPGDGGELTVPLTVRRPDMRAHAGEVSLPGGAVDAGDAGPQAAALREGAEEIGLDPAAVHLLGELDPVWIPVSNFELLPFVGALAARPRLVPAADEVAAVVELPLRSLLAPDAVTQEEIEIPGWTLSVAVYRYAGQRIWGATARTLAMFASVLRTAGLTG